MKGLVLLGGKGDRLRPLTNTINKHLLPLANKPIAFETIERVAEVGIKEVGVIVSAEAAQQTMEAVGDGARWGISITYLPQDKPAGLAHAVKVARTFLKDSQFLMMLGDNLFEHGLTEPCERFLEGSAASLVVLKQVEDPRRFGVAEVDDNCCCVNLVEKPQHPKTNLAITGAYFFSPAIHEAIDKIKPSRRNELEITDAIQVLVASGLKVQGYLLQGWWLDTGNKDSLLLANRKVLEKTCAESSPVDLKGQCRLEGNIMVQTGAVIEDSVITGPVCIGSGCHVSNSHLGPYVSVGPDTTIEESRISNSIILEGCHISRADQLVDSVVGKAVRISGKERNANASLFVGDNCVISY